MRVPKRKVSVNLNVLRIGFPVIDLDLGVSLAGGSPRDL